MWKIQKTVKKGKYLYAVVPEHPAAIKYGYVLMHRVVMENFLGRLLFPGEVVHHKDGNGHNNDISNLEVMSSTSHAVLHKTTGQKFCSIKCPACGRLFERAHNQTHLVKGGKFTACSDSCRGKFSSEMQYTGLTPKVNLAISENIQSIYNRMEGNSEETDNTGSVETKRQTPETVKL